MSSIPCLLFGFKYFCGSPDNDDASNIDESLTLSLSCLFLISITSLKYLHNFWSSVEWDLAHSVKPAIIVWDTKGFISSLSSNSLACPLYNALRWNVLIASFNPCLISFTVQVILFLALELAR